MFELAVLRKRGGQLLNCLRMFLVHLDTFLQQDHHTLGGEGREGKERRRERREGERRERREGERRRERREGERRREREGERLLFVKKLLVTVAVAHEWSLNKTKIQNQCSKH